MLSKKESQEELPSKKRMWNGKEKGRRKTKKKEGQDIFLAQIGA
jgi:chromatin remodeling complex protein RSC6